ncbi:MAG: flagellar hook-basal body complex protein FliE [Rhodothermales bacterium]
MNISDIQQLQVTNLLQLDDRDELPQIRYPDAEGAEKFKNAFTFAINQVNDAQSQASVQVESFIAGEQENLHEVMIKLNQAKTSFQLMVEVRNKMMDAYSELFRMQI